MGREGLRDQRLTVADARQLLRESSTLLWRPTARVSKRLTRLTADPGTMSPEEMAVLADCSEEVKERLRRMARRGADAARRLTNAERNRQQSRGGAEP